MFEFVNWLRAIAAVLITNSHYASIWPLPALSFGGHIGNCLYFFLSGFCLYNIKERFPKWYISRIIRIYPAVWIVNSVDLLVGRTHIGEFMGFVHCYLYPTWFHFISSIMISYIFYYIVRYIQTRLKMDIRWIMAGTLVLFVLSYLLLFDKSSYHIDDVNEKWVRFMFFGAMLMGAWLREKYEQFDSKITSIDVASFAGLSIVYFVTKISFSRISWISTWQIVLPLTLLIYIYTIARIFIKLEKNGFFNRINRKINSFIVFIAGHTLEIYLGQHLVIWAITGLPFPLSFLVVTASIVLYAWIIHMLSAFIQKGIYKIAEKF